MLFLCLFTQALSSPLDNCLKIKKDIEKSHREIISKEFPYWYSVSQAEKETGCKWRQSLDGHGSVGYFQLTPKFLDRLLRPIYPDYDKPYSKQHFYATAYYMKILLNSTPEKKLSITYQRFNGGDLVLKECKRAGVYEYKKCKKYCKRKDVCVFKKNNECKQYKNACDINYFYPVYIYDKGQEYKEKNEVDKIKFW